MCARGLAAVLLQGRNSHYGPSSELKSLGQSTVCLPLGVKIYKVNVVYTYHRIGCVMRNDYFHAAHE